MTTTFTIEKDNQAFHHAVSFVNQTHRLIFLTGKAGTGKTTFLRYIRHNSHKKMVVAAPTGVAAMNAGGMTLHSLFWLPFGLFVPEEWPHFSPENDLAIYDKRRLFSKIKLTSRKRALLREMEVLVIDEVSMVRADLLDAIDAILRSVRRDARPFGGLQVVFIGDLYQLPPVVRESDWQIMAQYYASPYFFDARVLQQQEMVCISLDKVYRQSDEEFITILNHIRNNTCTVEDLEKLNAHYQPDFVPPADQTYITLTTHNTRADEINKRALAALPGKSSILNAKIKGDFSASQYPVDTALELKIGAQVMFIRNDSGEDRRYYNGKIGQIIHIDSTGESLIVGFPKSTGFSDAAGFTSSPYDAHRGAKQEFENTIEVKREVWENIQYNYDKEKDVIDEDVLGTFSQFPLRLAWAITIHKSQGLTFDRAIIDAGASFAPGQVYVALSRLTSLKGLVLKSKIPLHSIRTDAAIVDFSANMLQTEELPEALTKAQQAYLGEILIDTFRWHELREAIQTQLEDLKDRNIPQKQEAEIVLEDVHQLLAEQEIVANKFRRQLQILFTEGETAYSQIHERVQKAVEWFLPQLSTQVIVALELHIEKWGTKKRTKRYVETLREKLSPLKRKKVQLTQCLEIAENLAKTVSL